MKTQLFSFCFRCQRVALINDKACGFCGGKFILQGTKSEQHNENIKNYYKRKKKKLS